MDLSLINFKKLEPNADLIIKNLVYLKVLL